jgi:ABC-type cobalamin/Fe3+-siderophores transport system ATPase subunit
MQVDFRIQNYRCFGDKPVRITLKKGVTAFIGANNSGKSTILRFFFEFRPLFNQIGTDQNWFLVANQGDVPMSHPPTVSDLNQLFYKGNDRDLVIRVQASDVQSAEVYDKEVIITARRDRGTAKLQVEGFPVEGMSITQLNNKTAYRLASGGIFDPAPVMKLFKELARSIYVGPYRSVGEHVPTGDYFDLQVGRAFVERWNTMKTGNDPRKTDAAVAVEQQIRRVFKFREFQINATEDKSSLQIIINNWSYKIQEVGSGLAQFIIALAHAAMLRPKYVLIDEPESNLHAPMQLSFLTALATYAEGGLLFASHNVGLARSAAERIYAVTQSDAGVSEIRSLEGKGTLSEIAGELNFSAYQELGFSVLLLVEGPAELKTVQQFLRKLGIEQQIVMIPLGGSSMINGAREDELRELKRITAKIFALIDSERVAASTDMAADRAAFQKICESVGIDCLATERRSLENYFPDKDIKKVLGQTFTALAPFERPDKWNKSENWRIAQSMDWSDLERTDVGKWLSAIRDEPKEAEKAKAVSA